MAYRSDTQVLRGELELRLVLRQTTRPARAVIPAKHEEPGHLAADPDDVLRWLRGSFGCETG